ncbi:11S globulin seed storage protein 1 [Sesamum angolense]|uniref:11S globulin seed storage protein 1 n=1 Tax=Sesamum angolense TaxID=2727404 RepID=A0AAE2C1R9_9LAMI|nr:11S globulin seed storage protein 1 [Sesamum angolense]
MALTSFLSFFILVPLLIRGLSAQLSGEQDFYWQNLQTQQQHKLQARTDCRVERLTAQEPTIRFESEAGFTEFWDRNNQQFECAGVAAVRNVIQPRGLLLPHYNNAPQLLYGTVIPGCAETFERDTQPRQDRRRRFMDRHQKVRQFRQGDILALPAGLTLWFYNNGGEPLVTVALLDTGNSANQLDQTFRHFFLAGNPQGGRQSYFGQRETEAQQGGTNNIFNGFDDEILADAFGVDVQTARRLKGQDDLRGRIVRAERFDIVLPGEEEEERWERDPYSGANGLEETLCTAKLRVNLDEPARADVYNPRGGRISSLNSQTLPILSWLRLSAEKGVLYRNGLVAPHWNLNAHSIIYITRGSGRFQVVGHTGRSVFDGVVREGQLIIVPQNYVVVKRASPDEGLEWISFKTNDNAMTSQLAGRLSAIRAMPEEVVMTAFQVSRDEARRLKYNREESRVFSSTSRYTPRSSRPMSYMPKPFEYALDVIKAMM